MLPVNLLKVLREGGMSNVKIYDSEHNMRGIYTGEQAILEFCRQREKRLRYNQILEILVIGNRLMKQLEENKNNFSNDMYQILRKEIFLILRGVEKEERLGVEER